MKKFILLLVAPLFAISQGFSQAANDECDTAIPINNVVNWCSGVGEFSNETATASGFGGASCVTNVSHDVWFSFIAVAPDVTVTVIGNTSISPGGTLSAPEVSLYGGNCGGTINELQCETDNGNDGIEELYKGGLTVGQTYYIRVDGRFDAVGTFQLCISNYNPPVNPGSDCGTRAFLCDKSPFVVQSVIGAGNNPDELADSCLGGLGDNSESNSTWFAWTCGVSGSLTFTLTPTNPTDDLDFVVYELPNGVTDCSGKIVRRCMAAGDFNFPSPCMGPTGLNETSNDVNENPGCGGGNDSWLAALDMQAGVSYALAVNNFTSTGNGFSIEFGGTGEFEGPQARFNTDDSDNVVCIGSDLTFTDASSSSLGTIVGYSWNFGVDASPATASGTGPHQVTYNSVGTKSVVLTVENSLGCIVTHIENIIVDPCCDTDNAMAITGVSNELECFDDPNGAIDLSVTSPFPINSYEWSTGATTEDINGLTGGDYTVTVTNQFCDTIVDFNVFSPPPFDVDTVMTLATCNGGSDGTLTLNVSGATPPFSFQWYDSPGFVLSDNFRGGLPIGFYTVTIRDANDCEIDLNLEVRELELELDPNVNAVFEPSCNGFSDGRIELIISNGLPPYQFDWNDGNGFVSANTLENIPAGSYTINVLDANGCMGQFDFSVGEPDVLQVTLDSLDVSCFGEADGSIVPTTTGGTYPYAYQWSDGQTDSVAVGLVAGFYTVTVTDINGCVTQSDIEVIQPAELFITGIDVVDVICFGDATGEFTVHASGGNPPYLYSLDGVNFQTDSVITDVPAGTYNVTVLDGLDCTDSEASTITQPAELVANAGPDLEVNLGYSVTIQGSHLPLFKPVTIEWSPDYNLSCTDCFRPEATPFETTTYYLTITDDTGCTDVDSVTVNVLKERPVFIPNTFTPNDDGANDIFTAYGGPATSQIDKMEVYDRWGGLVFRGENLPAGNDAFLNGWDGTWNGEEMNSGVYVYWMNIRFVDGFVGLYKGDITLVR